MRTCHSYSLEKSSSCWHGCSRLVMMSSLHREALLTTATAEHTGKASRQLHHRYCLPRLTSVVCFASDLYVHVLKHLLNLRDSHVL